jgi:two-component system, response regulator YesN
MSTPFPLLCFTIFSVMDMNTSIWKTDGSVLMTYEKNRLPDFIEGMNRDVVLRLSGELQNSGSCCTLTNEWGLSYVVSTFRILEEEPNLLVCGPFLMQVPDTARRTGIDQKKRIELESFYRGLKIVSNAKLQAIANIMDAAAAYRHVEIRIVNLNQNQHKPLRPRPNHPMAQQSDPGVIDLVELRYQIEKEIRSAVEHGDSDKIREIMMESKSLFDFSERFPNRPLRALKNTLVVFNTILRESAEKGHVQPFFLHQASEKFSKQIESSDTIDALNQLIPVMCDEYCLLVRDRSISGYSPSVQKAAKYLSLHFDKALDLIHLSELCHVHPAHLSRQFKKETGMTLTDYLQKRRIEEAKKLLRTAETPIGWIAGQLGFEDASYFTRTFKKLEGVTPTEYRNLVEESSR